METLGLMDKSLYDIGANDLLDVWDADFSTVRQLTHFSRFFFAFPKFCCKIVKHNNSFFDFEEGSIKSFLVLATGFN